MRCRQCGDGYVHEGVEACDDANEIDEDALQQHLRGAGDLHRRASRTGQESDVDCGGPTCEGCLDGEGCTDGSTARRLLQGAHLRDAEALPRHP
jgi:hypothetical protein